MAEKTRIWRMTYYRNIGFILANGLHCCNCGIHDPDYINIGHKSLIDNRGQSQIEQPPGGVLNDYIPFYFWYRMPMLYHIYRAQVKDYHGTQEEIIYLVSSVEKVQALGLPFLFTDRHAYLAHKKVYGKYEDLENLNWAIIKDNTWHQEYSSLKKELKQAEFLIHQHLPASGILGIIARNDEIANFVKNEVDKADLDIPVITKPEFYY